MNGKQRVVRSLELQEPDRVPIFELMINRPVAEAIMGRKMLVGIGGVMTGPVMADCLIHDEVDSMLERGFRDHVDLYLGLDLDAIVSPGVVSSLLFTRPQVRETGSFQYRFSYSSGEWWEIKVDPTLDTWGEIDHYLCHEGLDGFAAMVDRIEGSDFEVDKAIVDFIGRSFEMARDRFLVGAADVLMPNHNAWFPLFLEAMIKAPELVERYVRATTEKMMVVVDMYAMAGFDAIVGGTDFAGVNGPLFSPAMFDRFYADSIHRFIDHCHQKGLYFIKHTDGNVNILLERLLLNVKADAFHAIEPVAGMDIVELKKEYGRKLSLWGNVDCGRLLSTGSEVEVRDEVRRLIGAVAPGGGFVLCSSNSIHAGVNPHNYLAMIDEARKWGEYPINL
jgi:hypothetical protein